LHVDTYSGGGRRIWMCEEFIKLCAHSFEIPRRCGYCEVTHMPNSDHQRLPVNPHPPPPVNVQSIPTTPPAPAVLISPRVIKHVFAPFLEPDNISFPSLFSPQVDSYHTHTLSLWQDASATVVVDWSAPNITFPLLVPPLLRTQEMLPPGSSSSQPRK